MLEVTTAPLYTSYVILVMFFSGKFKSPWKQHYFTMCKQGDSVLLLFNHSQGKERNKSVTASEKAAWSETKYSASFNCL